MGRNRKEFDAGVFNKLYKQKKNDAEIGRLMGVSQARVRDRRIESGLKPNQIQNYSLDRTRKERAMLRAMFLPPEMWT